MLALPTLLSYLLITCSFRAKYHKLKFGTDPNQGEKKPELSEQGTHPRTLPTCPCQRNQMCWKSGWRAGPPPFFAPWEAELARGGGGLGRDRIGLSVPLPIGRSARCWATRANGGADSGKRHPCLLSVCEIDTQCPL